MEKTLMAPRLRLNKKVISRLDTGLSRRDIKAFETDFACPTVRCTNPECGSIIYGCKTDNFASCAPCVPGTKDPTPMSKTGC